MLHSSAQPLRLQGQNEFRAISEFSFVRGDEGIFVVLPRKTVLRDIQREGKNADVASLLAVTGDFGTLVAEEFHVDFGDRLFCGKKFRFGEHFTVFGYQVMPRKNEIRGGFPPAGVGVNVAADGFCRLHGDEFPAILRLADDLVAGGKIEYDRRPRRGERRRGAVRHPEIFADLHPDDEFFQIGVAEEKIRPERTFPAAEKDGAGRPLSA